MPRSARQPSGIVPQLVQKIRLEGFDIQRDVSSAVQWQGRSPHGDPLFLAGFQVAAAYAQLKCWPGENALTGPQPYGDAPGPITEVMYHTWLADMRALGKPVDMDEINSALAHEFPTNMSVDHSGSFQLHSIQHLGMERGHFRTDVATDTPTDWWNIVDFMYNVVFHLKLRSEEEMRTFLTTPAAKRSQGYLLDETEVETLIQQSVHEPFEPGQLTDTIQTIKTIWAWQRVGAQLKLDRLNQTPQTQTDDDTFQTLQQAVEDALKST